MFDKFCSPTEATDDISVYSFSIRQLIGPHLNKPPH